VKIIEKVTLFVGVHKDPESGDPRGAADNDSIVRTDVFYESGKGGGYYLVPVYIRDTLAPTLPNKAIVAHKDYSEWLEMKEENFLFSLYPNDLIKIKSKSKVNFTLQIKEATKSPETIELDEFFMYFKVTDIATGRIGGISHDGRYKARVGVKTLPLIEKYSVDVLGSISKVGREKRSAYSEEDGDE